MPLVMFVMKHVLHYSMVTTNHVFASQVRFLYWYEEISPIARRTNESWCPCDGASFPSFTRYHVPVACLWGWKHCMFSRPFKKTNFCFLALHSVFPLFGPFDVHRYHSYRNQSISRSAASALKYSCFGPYVNISGNGGIYIREVLFVQHFENALSHPPIWCSF